ncbi:MAG: HAD hydrolase-like protein, partial [Mycobacteriales bacterium]
RLSPGSRVLVVGTEALVDEIRDVGLEPVRTADPVPAAVVQGYGPAVGYAELADATVAIRNGALWVATNTDGTLPSDRGPLPGNGALVAALIVSTGQRPEVVGKPQPGLLTESVERTGAQHPLVVGDRLDTDIEGAVSIGADSLLVLTGVTTPLALLAAPKGSRPTYLAQDLGGLLQPHEPPTTSGAETRCAGFVSRWIGSELELSGTGDDAINALRALCAASWAAASPPAAVRAEDPDASKALRTLGLD